jgi:uncharacterized protein YfeS
MEFIGMSKAYDKYGVSNIYSPIADLLEVHLTSDYGSAVESVYFSAFLSSVSQKPRPTLEELFRQFHEYLDKLPKVTFRRKLKRIEIEFLSHKFIAEDDKSNKVSADKCNTAAEEVAGMLPLLKKRIKPADDFEGDRFLADATRLLATKIDAVEEWTKLEELAKAKRLALQATKTPWELLEIDWSQYHTNARVILDDPFFWQCADDLAPNGNDTGADLLEDYRRWDKRHKKRSPWDFLIQLLTNWDIEPIDWSITDEPIVRRLDKERSIDLSLCNEAIIALAFAVVKVRGACPLDIILMAIAALARTAILVKDSSLSDEIKKSWDEAIEKMRRKLKSLASRAVDGSTSPRPPA